jgi:hypothetical protein
MPKNNTILEKIGISNKKVKKWKSAGLKISYPMKARSRFLKSADGVFVYAADKFFPPLSAREIKEYTKNPEKFRQDFFKNLRFYTRFYKFLYSLIKKTEKLEIKEKIAALLSLSYLFQSAMDHHYYHFDRYLAYENYPQTPLGYWWKKLKDLFAKATGEKVSKANPQEDFLKLLSVDKEILDNFMKKLSNNEFAELKNTLKKIKFFEKTQEIEAKLLYGTHLKESKLLKTGFTIWEKISEIVKNHLYLLNKKDSSKLKKIIEENPIVGTRKLLFIGLKYFNSEILTKFETEITRWVK